MNSQLQPHHSSGSMGSSGPTCETRSCRQALIQQAIEHAVHFIPTQGPITVFIHHNTLHAFEDEPFEKAVLHAAEMFGCQPFQSENDYRKELQKGRIRNDDLRTVLQETMGRGADQPIGKFGTRLELRLAMMQHELRTGSDAELSWHIAEFDALERFCESVEPATAKRLIDETIRRWPNGKLEGSSTATEGQNEEENDESTTLQLLWRICQRGVEMAKADDSDDAPNREFVRHSDALREATGEDPDRLVNDVLVPFCSAFLDQGLATWRLPNRSHGFLRSFAGLEAQSQFLKPIWMKGVADELRQLLTHTVDPLQIVEASLDAMGVEDPDIGEFLRHSLLALPGWAGMIWQVEFNAPWLPQTAPSGTFTEFVALRLLLDRFAVSFLGKHSIGTGDLCHIRTTAQWRTRRATAGPPSIQRAYVLFQLAQICGWSPVHLVDFSRQQWRELLSEIESFSESERRRVFHLAYERKYRHETLDAIQLHWSRKRSSDPVEKLPPAYQVVCCIDEREESFRRHLEECDSECETFGMAGFFGVAMYYRGVGDGHFRPLCPIVITPKHYVIEEPAYSLKEQSRRLAAHRRAIGSASHRMHVGSRTLLAGWLAGIFGSLAAIPLVARVMFPATTARIRNWIGSIIRPAVTHLRIERQTPEPGPDGNSLGYSLPEMVKIVSDGLRTIGLTKQFARLVIFCGHGSNSLNNPHESAHDCGACGGGRGGSNARAFAQMANDSRVRRELAKQELLIPDDCVFVGAYHNTCDDSVTWYDLDRIPGDHRALFERARDVVFEAQCRNAHERCRRFESADPNLTPEEALRHVEVRAEDLSQVRPEYGHATNAICVVGRRLWSQGLFMDRRSFLASYDPCEDDRQGSILERILQAVIPVCSGINLEYYFSYVDPTGYGCGTKLPHNITSLLGVMNGAQSDLRTGLPWQMVEIHEPVRLLFIVETSVDTMQSIILANPQIERLVSGKWIQLAVFDAESETIHEIRDGKVSRYAPESEDLPSVNQSVDWFRGERGHLGFATILRRHEILHSTVESQDATRSNS